MSIAVFEKKDVEAKLRSIRDGSTVSIRYFHSRDSTKIRKASGQLRKRSEDEWVVLASSTQRLRFPNDDYLVISIDVLELATREPSQPFNDDAIDDEVVEVPSQNQRDQPPAEPSTPLQAQPSQQQASQQQVVPVNQPVSFQQMLAMFESNMKTVVQLVESRIPAATQPAALPTPQPQQPQDEITRLLLMSDALRGQDNPAWRLVPGLLLPRFVGERFHIVSIPHLLFQDVNSEMVRVPPGTAVPHYRSILTNCKLQFPNQVQVRQQMSNNNKDNRQQHMDDGNAGVRAQLERAERMFCEHLSRLDQMDSMRDFPMTKAQWMPFIDIGAVVLELYATLGFGFAKGGAKIAVTYSASIAAGKFDPSKLWGEVQSAKTFRE